MGQISADQRWNLIWPIQMSSCFVFFDIVRTQSILNSHCVKMCHDRVQNSRSSTLPEYWVHHCFINNLNGSCIMASSPPGFCRLLIGMSQSALNQAKWWSRFALYWMMPTRLRSHFFNCSACVTRCLKQSGVEESKKTLWRSLKLSEISEDL